MITLLVMVVVQVNPDNATADQAAQVKDDIKKAYLEARSKGMKLTSLMMQVCVVDSISQI